MSAEALFSIANPLALLGWAALALSPLATRNIDLVAGWLIPAVFSLCYAVLMLVHLADAPGGFGSLSQVQALFTDPDVALAGWLHYLAFDLFVGGWIVRDSRQRGIRHIFILPILPFVFMLGPLGLLAYLGLRLLHQRDTGLNRGTLG